MENKIFEKETKQDLMKKWEDFKEWKTPFANWDLMEGIGEGLTTKSLTMSSLFTFKILFNSTTCDYISCSLSCFIFYFSSNSFLSFSSLSFLILSYLAFSSSSRLFILLKLLMISLLSLVFFSLALFTQDQV